MYECVTPHNRYESTQCPMTLFRVRTREKKHRKHTKEILSDDSFFVLSLCNFSYFFPSILSPSLQLRSSAKTRNVYHCVRYRQVSMIRNDCLAKYPRYGIRVHNNMREYANQRLARSFHRCASFYGTAPKHCKHNKRCTCHVTLPYLRCDHIIPEINYTCHTESRTARPAE